MLNNHSRLMPTDSLISFEEAQTILNDSIVHITRIELLPIDDSSGRVLAQNIIAAHSTPPFDRAGVDGYAVRAEDTYGATPTSPKTLDVIETVYAGMVPAKGVLPGQCIQIATGAPMPLGADAMVMVEDTSSNGNNVTIFKSASPQDHVAPKGEDINKGDMILTEGTLLDAGKVGVLASQGLTQVKVYAKPMVAIMPTGEEIVEIGKTLIQGQIYDINSHTLCAVIKENGCIPVILPITGDNQDKLKDSLEQALQADMVITSGGSSVGEKDFLMDLLESRGTVLFHGIKIKPGKPTTFALVQNKPVLGMPGYPTSCLINAHLLLVPVLRKMAHLPPKRDHKISGILSESVSNHSERMRFVPVKIEDGIVCFVFKESRAIISTSQARGYIVIQENETIPVGSMVTAEIF